MRDTLASIHHFMRSHINERGQGIVEYSTLIAGIAITLIFVMGAMGVVFGNQVREAACSLVDAGARITACGEAVADRNRPPVALLNVENSPTAQCNVNEPCTIRNDSYDPDDLKENLTCEMTITEQATYDTCDNQTVTWTTTGIQQAFLNVTDPQGAVGTARPLIINVIDPDGNTPPSGYIESDSPANCPLDELCGPFTINVVDPDEEDTVSINWSVEDDKGVVSQPAAKTTDITFDELPTGDKWKVNVELDDDVNAPVTVSYLVGVYDPTDDDGNDDDDDGNDDDGNDDDDDGNDDDGNDDDDAGKLTIETQSGDDDAAANEANFRVKIDNNTDAPATDVSMRFYMTAEGNATSYEFIKTSNARNPQIQGPIAVDDDPDINDGNLYYYEVSIDGPINPDESWVLTGILRNNINPNVDYTNDWWSQVLPKGAYEATTFIPAYANGAKFAGNIPQVPNAVINAGSYTCEVDTPCIAIAGTSSSANGGITQHEWKFTGPAAVTVGNGTNPNPTFQVAGSYQVEYRVMDSMGIQSPWSQARTVTVTESVEDDTDTVIFIGDLDATTDIIGGGTEWRANVDIFLVDEDGNPVSGLDVRMNYNKPYDASEVCTTGANGRCIVQTPGMNLTDDTSWKYAEQVTVSYSQIDSVPAGYVVDMSQSSDPDGDSDGRSITVIAPDTGNDDTASPAVFIGDIDDVSTGNNSGDWTPAVEVLVVDQDGNPISGVSLDMSFAARWNPTTNCTTGANGRCTVEGPPVSTMQNKSWMYAESVDVSFVEIKAWSVPAGYAVDAAQNTDPDGDSDGSSITVVAP